MVIVVVVVRYCFDGRPVEEAVEGDISAGEDGAPESEVK